MNQQKIIYYRRFKTVADELLFHSKAKPEKQNLEDKIVNVRKNINRYHIYLFLKYSDIQIPYI